MGKIPGRVAQLVRTLFWYTRVAGSIFSQGTYKNQQWMHEWVEQQISLSLSLYLFLSLKISK